LGFFREAKRLLDVEDGKDSLPSLQASLEFVVYYYGIGQDQMGDKHLYDCLRMANSLKLFRINLSALGPGGSSSTSASSSDKLAQARRMTAWCVFDMMR